MIRIASFAAAALPAPNRAPGLLSACLAAPSNLWQAILTWHMRGMEAHAAAMLDDHICQDMGLPPLPPHVKPSLRFI